MKLKSFVQGLAEIARPLGMRRLIFVCAALLAQAIAQLIALSSVLPFLAAAADMRTFRATKLGFIFVETGLDLSDKEILLLLGLTSILLLISANLVLLATDFVRARYAYAVGHETRMLLLERLLARPYEYHLAVNSTRFVKTITDDVNSFTNNVLSPSMDIAARLALVLLLVSSLMVLEPVVCALGLAGLTAYYVALVRPIRERAMRASDDIKESARRVHFEVGQILGGLKPITFTGTQAHFVRRCRSASLSISKIIPRTVVYSAAPRNVLEMLVFGGLITWVLVVLMSGSDLATIMPRIGIVAIIAYRLMPSIQLIVGQGLAVTSSRHAMEEVLTLLREQPKQPAKAVDPLAQSRSDRIRWQDEMRFDKVHFGYTGSERMVLNGVSFSVRKGEHVAFVGPSGSGKSTIVDLILGLLEPTQGSILVDEVPLTSETVKHWRKNVGYVPQEPFLLDGSIAENVAFGREREQIDLGLVHAALDRAQANSFVHETGRGVWGGVGERGATVSGGQRQRLALARALYGTPDILILDEATSALDPYTEKKVTEEILKIAGNVAVVTVAHRLSTVQECDRIYFIQDGAILAFGTYDDLLCHSATFKAFASH